MASREREGWAWVDGELVPVTRRKPDHNGGMQRRRMSREQIDADAGKSGLWTGSGNSFFDNSRTLVTQDPSEYEISLGKQRWLTPLRENGKGRVIQ